MRGREYVLASYWEFGTPARQLLWFPVLEGCLRFAIVGGVAMALLTLPVALTFEKFRAEHFDDAFHWDYVSFQVGFGVLMALVVGWLVLQLRAEYASAQSRGRGGGVWTARSPRRPARRDNRCARALARRSSSEALVRHPRQRGLPRSTGSRSCRRGRRRLGDGRGGCRRRRDLPDGIVSSLRGTLLEEALGQPAGVLA
jgi:hypothetical protein